MSSAAHRFHLNPIASENLLDPAPLYRELRRSESLHWSDAVRGWLVTRHADVVDGFRDARLGTPPGTAEAWGLPRVEDGHERLRLRRRMAAGFTLQALDTWREPVRQLVASRVERMREAGRMEAVRELTRPLPALVMAEVMGIPAAERGDFLEGVLALAALHAPEAGADEAVLVRHAQQTLARLRACLRRVVALRQHAPGVDLLSRMMEGAGETGEDPREWVTLTALHLLTEHASTEDQLGNGLHELLVHTAQFEKLRQTPSLLRAAVEETLRFSPAQPFAHRVVGETFQWQGRTLRKGDEVFLGVGAANRDPRGVADPDQFELTRDPYGQKHLSFGFGAHHRLCAGLVRLELESLFTAVLTHLPGLTLDAPRLPRLKCHSLLYRGFETLPVRW